MQRDDFWNKDNLPVPSPCDEDWDAMDGDEQRRFCGKCQRHVVDLSAMTRCEADATLQGASSGGLCVRYTYGETGDIVLRSEPILPASMLVPARRLAIGLGLGAGAAVLMAGLLRTQGAIAPPRQVQGEVAIVAPVTPAAERPAPGPPQRDSSPRKRMGKMIIPR